MNKTDLLKEIQSYKFSAYDMLLYLDTHSDDKKAFELFKSLVKKYKELTTAYESQFGPLSPMSISESNTFNWLDGAWAWEKGANA